MLAAVQLTEQNPEAVVYTCPSGKKAFIYVDICPSSYYGYNYVTVYVNNIQYGRFLLDRHISIRLTLDENDSIRVVASLLGYWFVNVFVHGIEVNKI